MGPTFRRRRSGSTIAGQHRVQNLAKSKKKDKKQVAAEENSGREQQEAILAALARMNPAKLYRVREAFIADLDAMIDRVQLKLAAPIRKAILAALSERDEAAEVCRDAAGNPEPDSDLRDHEKRTTKGRHPRVFRPRSPPARCRCLDQ